MSRNGTSTGRSRPINILCTIGPASLERSVLQRLEARGVDLFRINLSHTPLGKVEETIKAIRAHSSVPISLDTEGAQVRTGLMDHAVEVRDGDRIDLCREVVVGNARRITLTPASVFDSLRPNTLIGLDFDGVVLLVVAKNDDGVETVAINGGRIGSNKAVTVDPPIDLPALSEKDLAAIEIGRQCGIMDYCLSFASSAEDVRTLRRLAAPGARIISKIESRAAIRNLDDILSETDEILIDRGDLSRDAPIETLPFLQKMILRKANAAKVPANVATNLLESMIVNKKPTRAELNDITNTLLDGAQGLVLAAETAIGAHPIEVVDTVLGLIRSYERSLDGFNVEDLLDSDSTLLPSLHGRIAVGGRKPRARRARSSVRPETLPAVEVDAKTAIDVEQIIHRAYSPLNGFMTKADLESVLDHFRLTSGATWTMPILLQGKTQEFAAFGPGQTVRLMHRLTGRALAVMHIEDKYEVDPADVARRWFGTDDVSHPGVAGFVRRGLAMLGGAVEQIGHSTIWDSAYHITPRQTRALFEIKQWSRIVGFHADGLPTRVREHVISHAVGKAIADGMFVQEAMGAESPADLSRGAVMSAYRALLSSRVPNALLASASFHRRLCGPREAVFVALVKKNFGCTHLAMTADQFSVDGLYEVGATAALFEELGDIGINPIFFPASQEIASDIRAQTGAGPDAGRQSFDQVVIESVLAQRPIPEWAMSEDVASALLGVDRSAPARRAV